MNLINSHNLKYFIKKKKTNKGSKIDFACVYFSDFARFPNYHETISNLSKNSAVIYREYNLDKQERQELAIKIQKICKKFQHKFIIGKDLAMAKKMGADGIHFSDLDKKQYQFLKKTPQNFITSLACHEISNIIKTKNSNFDIIFFSPIFKTNSHLKCKAKGVGKLNQAKSLTKKPIFALGGINQSNISKISQSCHGIGAIEIFQEN